MAKFTCRSSEERVLEAVKSFCEVEGLILKPEKKGNGAKIMARKHDRWGARIDFEHSEGNKVHVDVDPWKTKGITFLIWTLLGFSLLSLGRAIEEGMIHPLNMTGGVLKAVLFFAMASGLHGIATRKGKQIGRRLVDHLRGQLHVIQATPHQDLLGRYDHALVLAVGVFLGYTTYKVCKEWLGNTFTIIVVALLLSAVLAVVVCMRLRDSWRVLWVESEILWLLTCWLSSLYWLLVFMVVASDVGQHSREAFFTPSPEGFDQAIAHLWRKETVDLRAVVGSSSELQNAVRVYVLCGVSVVLLLVFGGNARKIHSTLRQSTFGSGKSVMATPAEGESKSMGRLSRLLIVLQTGLSSVWLWFSIVISIEMTAYSLLGSCLLFRQVVWVAEFLEVSSARFFGDGAAAYLVAKGLLAPMILPGIVNCLLLVFRVVGLLRMKRRLMRKGPGEQQRNLELFIEEVSTKRGMEPPTLCVSDEEEARAYAVGLVWSRRNFVVVSAGLSAHLQEIEAKGLIAHEVFHATSDARRLARLKFLSVVLLSPCNLLCMLYDFPGRERAADCFAAEALGSPEPMIRALTKLSLVPKKTGRALVAFLLGDTLLGSSYPFLAERLAALKAMSTKSSER